eukprot:2398112-Pyramimonas_sp.AAC.1
MRPAFLRQILPGGQPELSRADCDPPSQDNEAVTLETGGRDTRRYQGPDPRQWPEPKDPDTGQQ